jgi:beta-lactamase class A
MTLRKVWRLVIAIVAGFGAAPATAQYPAMLPVTPGQAPAGLAARIAQLGAGFNGRVGIAVEAVEGRWRIGYHATELYPQQSVSKFWVAMTAMEAIDSGRVRLSDPVTLTRGDLTVFNQPIAARILNGGSYTTTLGSLMFDAITKSDNTANDKLMRAVGGPAAVRAMIASKQLGAIRFYEGERALQSRIAGLTWSPRYSVGNGFSRARDLVPRSIRQRLFDDYIDNPYDGAAPASVVNALARLKRGELLSPSSTAHLLTTMSNTRTGKNRLRGGMRPGWSLSHKTGTGQILGSVQAGYNDIGVITAPDGRSYAVAVMIKKTSTPLITRMTLMNNVVRAVIDAHGAVFGTITL